MNISEVFQISGTIIASIGGSSALIVGVSNWVGKLWANRILESERAKYSKEIEKYKNELKIGADKINLLQDKALHITKVQFDSEYKIYMDIWESLKECTMAAKLLYPCFENVPLDPKEEEEYKKNKYIRFVDAYNKYLSIIDRYEPFYNESFDEKLEQIRKICNKIGRIFKKYEFDMKYNVTYLHSKSRTMTPKEEDFIYEIFEKEISQLENNLAKEIRSYLKSLKLNIS